MILYLNILGFIVTSALTVYVKRSSLPFAGSYRFISRSHLTADPAPPVPIGSNVTVYCHIPSQRCNGRSKISLEVNGATVEPWKSANCSTVIFKLHDVQVPKSKVLCKLNWPSDQLEIVGGMDLRSGHPPDKPGNIICETTKSSVMVNCSWERGKETYLPTAYNISLHRENGTQIHSYWIQDAQESSIPRAVLMEHTKYQVLITAYNQLGASQSDPFTLVLKDIVLPDSPQIVHVKFGNNSAVAMLQWETTEFLQHLQSDVRLRKNNGSWDSREATRLSEDLIQVDTSGLEPLTEYEFQMRSCTTTSGRPRNATPGFKPYRKRSSCSKWSPSEKKTIPGRGPPQLQQVWRILGNQTTNTLQVVTVLWKPLPWEEHSGEVQLYKIFLGNNQKQEVICRATLRQCLVQVPLETEMSISVVASYGTSPPADVPLKLSGDSGPTLSELAPTANGSGVLVSWSWTGAKRWSSPGELLHYVMEWTSVPTAELWWEKLAKDLNSTVITGLIAGVRYNVSLYAVTTRGVSAPSSSLVYSKEQKPASGPEMSVLVHKAGQILIQWDELAVDQQRGFIINYTMYVKTLNSGTERSVTVSASGPRRMLLDCPEGALALQLTASTSAGEGPRGNLISSQPVATPAYLLIVVISIIALFMAIMANLMCCKCVRKRIKQRCTSWGPAWLVGNVPKLGNSNAIRLLELDGNEPSFSYTHNDPPLSPITCVYPSSHVEGAQAEAATQQPSVDTPLLETDPRTMLADSRLEHAGYKPQVVPPQEEQDATEEQRSVAASGEEDGCSDVLGELLGDLLSGMEVDFLDSTRGLTLSSISGLLWPKVPETESVLKADFLQGRRGTESSVEVNSTSVDLQPDEKTLDESLSLYAAQAALTGGYFPQTAAVSVNTAADTQR